MDTFVDDLIANIDIEASLDALPMFAQAIL
jgi:hypothetical protein